MYLEKFKLGGKTAIVTGGAQGIGLACVEALAEAGAKVVIADRDAKVANMARTEMKKKGYDVELVDMDVTDPTRVTKVANQLTSRYGQLDILVNNAGIARSETPAETVSDEHWLNVIDVNLKCYYNASKAAVHHLTKSLAAEWGARGVRVNAVAPTYIETPLNAFVKSNPRMYDAWIGGTPMARLGQVEEIASVVLFLASDAASLMTGSIVLVDGGYTCW
jgi:NAD(P)-dependent dehydrogenase (short-subunit alcohol dehydrogenase family)